MKKLLLAFLCLGISNAAFAQFNAFLYDSTPLTQNCDGTGAPISHGYLAYIWWDHNDNGPDPSDIQPTVGNGPAQCNFNQIDMGSGEDLLGIPGGFATNPAFSILSTPPLPSRYFVTVTGNNVIWTSAVFTITTGLNEYDLSDGWTCAPITHECVSTTDIYLDSTAVGYWRIHSECITVCEGELFTVNFGPMPRRILPIFQLYSGCDYGAVGTCDIECTPGQVEFDPHGFVFNYDEQTRMWSTTIVPTVSGCMCLSAETTPVEQTSFDGVGRDRCAMITWATASENAVDHFELKRDGQLVKTVDATNSSAGSAYSYLDEGLVNGRTYEYTLFTVNNDGSVEQWTNTVTATPSSASAVITEYALHQNYPNPFNSVTNFVFDMVAQNAVTLTIYNVSGELVSKPINGTYSAGRHTVSYDANSLATGLYFYTLSVGKGFTSTHKMLLLK